VTTKSWASMDDDASESLQRLNVILKVNIYTSSYSNTFNKSNWFARVCWTTLPERQQPSILAVCHAAHSVRLSSTTCGTPVPACSAVPVSARSHCRRCVRAAERLGMGRILAEMSIQTDALGTVDAVNSALGRAAAG